MSDHPEELDFEERRKRLEQLFAAEPHLSPTMKARQLDEEPMEKSNGHHNISELAAPSSVPLTEPERSPLVPLEVDAVVATDNHHQGMMSIAQAREELLRIAGDPSERGSDNVESLRERVLNVWRRDIFADQ